MALFCHISFYFVGYNEDDYTLKRVKYDNVL